MDKHLQRSAFESWMECLLVIVVLIHMTPFKHIADVPVYVFERHSSAIIPWAHYRRNHAGPCPLVTLDRHTDTMTPFLRWAYWNVEPPHVREKWEPVRKRRIEEFVLANDQCIELAAKDLWNDEHIQAAIELHIVSEAFIVAFNSPSKDNRRQELHYLPSNCHHGCGKRPHDDECVRRHSDLAIADAHLAPLLTGNRSWKLLYDSGSKFILDIDLDYFRTQKALRPDSHEFFSSLAKRASIITIATEPNYVKDSRLDEDVDSESSLSALISILDGGYSSK